MRSSTGNTRDRDCMYNMQVARAVAKLSSIYRNCCKFDLERKKRRVQYFSLLRNKRNEIIRAKFYLRNFVIFEEIHILSAKKFC